MAGDLKQANSPPLQAMIGFTSTSEPGGHLVNEDTVLIHPISNTEAYLCFVADGQGGRAGGLQASQLACQTCLTLASQLPLSHLLQAKSWTHILAAADQEVSKDSTAGFTTLVAFCITKDQVCGGSNGDSALLTYQNGRSTILTARQRKNPPVGSGNAHFTSFAENLASPWTVLAMTDGVWKYAGWEHILTLVAGMQGADLVEAIKDRARMRNGQLQDDFTLMVLQDG